MPASENPAFTAVAAHYDELMCGVPYDYWADHVERLFERRGLQPDTLLDLACGTGAVSEIMAMRGYQVVGVDISPGMIAQAEKKAAISGGGATYLVQDACELDLTGRRFDACYSLFDSLNYITEPARLELAFGRVLAHLQPGGAFVFDVNSAYALKHDFFTQNNLETDERLRYVWRSEYDPETRLCTVAMRFFLRNRRGVDDEFRETHVQFAYEEAELRDMLARAGFHHIETFHSYTEKPVRSNTDRIFFLASRPLGG